MFERIANVTYRTPTFARSKLALERFFRYDPVFDGVVGEQLADVWRAPEAAGRRCCVLQARSREPFTLRLIEGEDTPDHQALTTYGWNAAELLVEDVLALADELRNSDFTIVGGPRDLMNNGVAVALQVLGPGGELFYLTQISGRQMQATYGAAKSFVDRLFIAVLGTADDVRTRDFYRPLVNGVTRPRKFSIRVLSAAHGLDPDNTRYRISAACLPNQFRIEIDSYPESATRRPLAKGDIPPGMSMVSFVVPSLDEIPLPCDVGLGPDAAPYFGCRVARIEGPDGEWIELLEGFSDREP